MVLEYFLKKMSIYLYIHTTLTFLKHNESKNLAMVLLQKVLGYQILNFKDFVRNPYLKNVKTLFT